MRALIGSLTGLGESLDQMADDAEHESIDTEALRRIADRSYETGLDALRHELGRGTFLREEALRHWQSYIGADQITRFFSEGIIKVRLAIADETRYLVLSNQRRASLRSRNISTRPGGHRAA